MKLDLLKKLTALANNNPNENEANLAARRVCIMLAEAKFIVPVELPKVNIRPQGEWNPTKAQEDFIKRHQKTASEQQAQTWNDVHRSEEPQFSSSRQYAREPNFRSASNPTGPNPFYEWFRQNYSEPSWHMPKEPINDPYKSKKEESSQTKTDPFSDLFKDEFSFDLDDLIGKQVDVKIPRQDPKGYKESSFKNYNPIDDCLDTNCIICKNFFRISKKLFEHVKGCYVCDSCKGKDK